MAATGDPPRKTWKTPAAAPAAGAASTTRVYRASAATRLGAPASPRCEECGTKFGAGNQARPTTALLKRGTKEKVLTLCGNCLAKLCAGGPVQAD